MQSADIFHADLTDGTPAHHARQDTRISRREVDDQRQIQILFNDTCLGWGIYDETEMKGGVRMVPTRWG